MLRGQDIVLLVKLTSASSGWTVRDLGHALELSIGPVHRSIRRLADAGLYDPHRKRVVLSAAEEFLVHGLKYVFPARPQSEARGISTAWAAPPLSVLIDDDHPLPPVWPTSDGHVRGLALDPLHASAIAAARDDRITAERLALLDALRAGDARIRGLAAEQLRKSLNAPVPVSAS